MNRDNFLKSANDYEKKNGEDFVVDLGNTLFIEEEIPITHNTKKEVNWEQEENKKIIESINDDNDDNDNSVKGEYRKFDRTKYYSHIQKSSKNSWAENKICNPNNFLSRKKARDEQDYTENKHHFNNVNHYDNIAHLKRNFKDSEDDYNRKSKLLSNFKKSQNISPLKMFNNTEKKMSTFTPTHSHALQNIKKANYDYSVIRIEDSPEKTNLVPEIQSPINIVSKNKSDHTKTEIRLRNLEVKLDQFEKNENQRLEREVREDSEKNEEWRNSITEHIRPACNLDENEKSRNLLVKLFGAAMKLIIQIDETINNKLESKCEKCEEKIGQKKEEKKNENIFLENNNQISPAMIYNNNANNYMNNQKSSSTNFTPQSNYYNPLGWGEQQHNNLSSQINQNNTNKYFSSSTTPNFAIAAKKFNNSCFKCGQPNHKRAQCPFN